MSFYALPRLGLTVAAALRRGDYLGTTLRLPGGSEIRRIAKAIFHLKILDGPREPFSGRRVLAPTDRPVGWDEPTFPRRLRRPGMPVIGCPPAAVGYAEPDLASGNAG